MVSTCSCEARVSLVILSAVALSLVGCASTVAPSEACGPGTHVEAESSAFCVYRRDSPLVIEGGFECPASFELRIEMAHNIVCGDRALQVDQLPLDLCRQVGDDCELAQLAELAQDERIGGPGECIWPCERVEDCVSGSGSGFLPELHGVDNYACLDGACRYMGCNDDDECAADNPGSETVCRSDLFDEYPYCRDACEQRADCQIGATAPQDAARFDCVDGGCAQVGCTSDEGCYAPAHCVDAGRGVRECAFVCETAEDCAQASREGLGLDEPVPTDPWTYASAFICREGVCEGKPPGCENDADCEEMGGPGLRCKLPR